ncbi:glycosyltransferase [Paenibacillus sp. CAA11]|nr:glycosyltransferase [Paenibacillus sp. CAA11]
MSDEDKRRVVEAYQRGLNAWFHQYMVPRPSFADAAQVCLAYRQGYADAAGIKAELQRSVPLPLRGSASVVITVCNEEETIGQLLHELGRLPVREKVVVLNGCTDRSLERAAESPDTIMVSYRERLGHDVGRAIGATLTSGDIVLFLDGDMLVPAEELAAFLYAVDGGADAALNDITPFLPSFPQQDQVTRCKLFLNQALGRPDLQANSLTAVPHALSRKAIATVGSSALGVPPKAQAIAILEGLQVCAPCSVDVIGRNRIRPSNTGMGNQVAKLIVGDHVEALQEAMRRHGRRLLWQTNSRAVLAAERNLSLRSEQSVHHKKRKTDPGGGEP